MGEPAAHHRLYHELAEWFPLVTPPEHYEEEAAFAARLLHTASLPVHDVLELGSGGGHNASHLKAHLTLTLVDRSPEMLRQSQRLNPECEHVEGDMLTVRLGRQFDAVFVHDAVSYLTTDADLRQLLATAFVHCRPGGLVLIEPDDTRETFVPATDHGGTDAPDGRGVRYLEWSWDPDPDDTWILTAYALLLRDADGTVRMEHEIHRHGLFGTGEWLQLLADAGFDARAVPEETSEDRPPRTLFVGHRPPDPPDGDRWLG